MVGTEVALIDRNLIFMTKVKDGALLVIISQMLHSGYLWHPSRQQAAWTTSVPSLHQWHTGMLPVSLSMDVC